MMNLGNDQDFPCVKTGLALLVLAAFLGTGVNCSVNAQTRLPDVSITSGFSAKDNGNLIDEDGDSPAFLVLRNNLSPNTPPLDFGGWALSMDPTGAVVWEFPPKTILVPQEDLIVFASGKNRISTSPQRLNHTDFAFPCEIPYVGLLNPQRQAVSVFRKLDPTCDSLCRGVQVFNEKTLSRYFVPKTDALTGQWVNPDFDDSNWARGGLGLGYEVQESSGRTDMILYATMDRVDLDLSANIVKDVSGSSVVHNGKTARTINLSTGQIQAAIDVVERQTIQFRHHEELDPGLDDFTVSIWARTFGQGDEVLVAKGGLSLEGPGWAILNRKNDTLIRLSFGSEGLVDLSLPRIKIDQWTHLAFVIDRAEKSAFAYVDGTIAAKASIPGSPLIAPKVDLWIGARPDGSSLFDGAVDEFAIWRRGLSEQEVRAVAQTGLDGKRLDEGTAPANPIYTNLISTDVESAMHQVNSSLYVRVPFIVPDLNTAKRMNLFMNYDDGFVCYVNGTEVARRNAPSTLFPPFNSTAVSDRPDGSALAAELIDISVAVPLLRAGENVLAIHALNISEGASRFVINPQLCLEEQAPEDCEKTTNDREFWLTFPGNAPEDTENPLEISVCVAGAAGTTGSVDIPGLGFSKTFTIPANGPTPAVGTLLLPLPKEASLELSGSVESKGVRIRTSADVSVYGTTRIDYSTDSFLGLPVSCLGRDYVALGYKNAWKDVPLLNGSQIGLVAPYDGTKVLIDPGDSASGGVPFEVELDEGETYMLRDTSDHPADLSGARIRSNLPIGVFAGHRCANINSEEIFFCDTVLEQLLPISGWGTRYFSAPLKTRNHILSDGKGDTLRVTAAENNTFVTVTDDAGSNVIVLSANQIHEQRVIGPSQVVSEKPVLSAVYANSSDFDVVLESDPFMVMLQPERHWLDRYIICAPPTEDGVSGFEQSYVNIIVRNTVDAATLRLNGAPIVGFLPLGGTSYFYAQVDLDPTLEGHVIRSTRATFGVTVYGFSEYDSYGYPGGMRFDDVRDPFVICPPDISVATDQNCEGLIPDLSQLIQVIDPCNEGGARPKPEQDCFEFEDLKIRSLIRPGDTLTVTSQSGSQTATITVLEAGFSAVGAVTNGGKAGHNGNEIRFSNINLSFDSSALANGFSLAFGEYSGTVNLGLNGELKTVENLEDLHGETLGGAQIAVTGGSGGEGPGILTVRGSVSQFVIGGADFFIDHLCSGGSESSPNLVDCYEFEDQTQKTIVRAGDQTVTVNASGESMLIEGDAFTLLNGQETKDGSATIRQGSQAGGSGNEFAIDNILLNFVPAVPFSTGFTFLFGEYGGDVNLMINGELAIVEDFSDLDGKTLGGRQISVATVIGQGLGKVRVLGEIKEFGIGGQELFIDNICSLPIQGNTGIVVDRGGFATENTGIRTFATAGVGANNVVKQDPLPGVVVGLGTYDVSVSVFDPQGILIGSCVTKVQVVDGSKVTVVCPPDISVECTNPDGANVSWDELVALSDACKMPVKVKCSHRSGDLFPIGSTPVTCTVESASGETSSCTFLVTVTCKDESLPEDRAVSIKVSADTGLTLDWEDGGQLEVADSPAGPWRPVTDARPGFNVNATASQSFFRVRF
jgi:hypothetical protein